MVDERGRALINVEVMTGAALLALRVMLLTPHSVVIG